MTSNAPEYEAMSEGSCSEDDEDEDSLSDESDDGNENTVQAERTPPASAGDGTENVLWTRFVPVIQEISVEEEPPKGSPTPNANKAIRQGEALSAFRLFFDKLLVDKICEYTTAESRRPATVRIKNWMLTPKEFERFLGFLIGRAAFDAKQMGVKQLRSAEWGPQFFRKSISHLKLDMILRFLRFDDKSTRAERLKQDRLAMFSEVWHRFTRNCRINYLPGCRLNLDFQMVHSKVRCKFTQQIQEQGKPNKTGLLFMLLVDPDTNYVVHGVPYLHETKPSCARHVTERLALNLLQAFTGTERTIVTGESITSVQLVDVLLQKNTKLVGTTKVVNKGANAYKNIEPLTRYETVAYKSPHNLTLTVYRETNDRPAMVLSSKHTTVTLKNAPNGMPDTYEFQKQNGQAVKLVDYSVQQLSTRVKCNRWTMYVFYNLVDLAVLNSWILYQSVTGSKLNRRQFMLQLAEELCAEEPTAVTVSDQLDDPLKCTAVFGSSVVGIDKSKRSRCAIRIAGCKRNKTSIYCRFCQKTCCCSCSSGIRNVCKYCYKQNSELLEKM